MSNVWEIIYLVASSFLFFAYLIILFHIVIDLFRDPVLGGGRKALWLVGLLFLPFLTALLYVLIRGNGMGTRQRSALERARADTEAYIRDVARTAPADQIAAAKALLDAGTINQGEFDKLKEKALA
ncbi:MAG: PLDc N-terminal domain-containing protein [Chromatiaceae bacterium]|nr:PLDc N-terminal domain-containing protein [Chromatiaceae bacterium]MCF7996200.1 PLDc N-terminal domain-containing protein [Chromatiaceae bacterium]